MKRFAICAVATVGAALVLSSPLAAQTLPVSTAQQDFDAATKLDSDGNYAGALAAWQAFEQRPGVSRRTLALVRLRKSRTMFHLGRPEEAAEEARAGLAALPSGDDSLNEDRYLSWFTIGQITESQLDYATAVDAYRKALALANDPSGSLAALRGLVTTGTFIDSDAAMADMARAEALITATTFDAKSVAIVRSAESRLMLSRGDYKAARVKAGEAVKLLGGLTTKTDLYDVAARSDYSIAALLLGNTDSAREYMAMTGAGRLPKGEFDPGVQMLPPPCGGDAGLKPDDAAVVQFSIRDDGAVIDVAPIYAAGGGAAALEFARAVRDWSWTPEQTKGLPSFFRYRVRVEMRCSTAFVTPSIATHLAGSLSGWLADRNVEEIPDVNGSDAAILPKLRVKLAAVESSKGANALALVPLLYAIATNRVVPNEEAVAAARRGLALLDAADAPPLARLAFARMLWGEEYDSRSSWHGYVDQANRALGDTRFNTSPEARAAIRLAIAGAIGRHDRAAARGALQAVANDIAIEQTSPLRAAALMRLASLEVRTGDVAAARATFDKSGLDAKQCALIDSPPHLLHAGGDGFPMEAMRWGFEGWTQIQFDIAADGKVLAPRAVIAYPPFVFTKAGTGVIGDARYESTYRPNGALACGGSTNRVRFVLP